jgi:hypothetical protein
MLNVWLKAAAWTAMLLCLVGLPVSVDEWMSLLWRYTSHLKFGTEATATLRVSTNWPSKS